MSINVVVKEFQVEFYVAFSYFETWSYESERHDPVNHMIWRMVALVSLVA